MVARPRRIYYDEKRNKYYYLVKGKKKFIRVPEGMSQKQIQKINLVNIIGDVSKARKVRPRRKTRRIRLEKPIMEDMKQVQTITPFGSVVSFVRAKDGLPSEVKKEPNIVNPVEPDKNKDIKESLEKNAKEIKELQNLLKGALERKPSLTPTEFGTRPPSEITSAFTRQPSDFRTPRPLTPLGTPISLPSASPQRGPQRGPVDIFSQALFTVDESVNENEESKTTRSNLMPSLRNPPSQRQTPSSFSQIQIENQRRSQTLRTQGLPPIPRGGRGDGDDDGLFNNEIENILQKRVRKVVPVIASDEVNDLVDIVDNGDKEFMAVINTNPSTSDGSGDDGYRVGHWRCIYVDNRDDYPSVEVYDPLGDEPEKELIKVLHRIAQKMNPETLFKYKVNRVKLQDDESANCGHFVMKFLEERHRGVPFSKATMFDDVMESCGDKSDIGEMQIKKFKKYL